MTSKLCNVCLGTKRYQTMGFIMTDCTSCIDGRIEHILDSTDNAQPIAQALEKPVHTETCEPSKPKSWSRKKGAKRTA